MPGCRPAASIVAHGPAAEGSCGRQLARTAAGPWQRFPDWAAQQLRYAVEVAEYAPRLVGLATHLHRHWFTRPLGDPAPRPVLPHGRRALVGSDGWWRTWGRSGAPSRRDTVRLVLSPRPDRIETVVSVAVAVLQSSPQPWALACTTMPWRIRRSGAVALDLSAGEPLPVALLAELAHLLEPVVPPLCLPVARGVGLTGRPPVGISFGAHRCQLLALALRREDSADDPASAIASTFAAHGVDPYAPHR